MSVSLTISNLDDDTFRRLQAEAQRRGVDLPAAASAVLAEGLKSQPSLRSGMPHHDLDHLAGTWSEAEAKEFLDAIADFGRIEPEMWQ